MIELAGESDVSEFRKLAVWRKSHELALATYRLTANFPESERFGLTDQMRRAAAAISANIAEGHGRPGKREFANFLGIARGSLCELQALTLLARDLGFAADQPAIALLDDCEEVGNMLGALIARLRKSE